MAHRYNDPETHPCLKESDLSMKCLQQNYYMTDKCEKAFLNYNNCMSFWRRIMKQRRRANIKPAMPGEKERERIRVEHANGRNVISSPVDDEEKSKS